MAVDLCSSALDSLSVPRSVFSLRVDSGASQLLALKVVEEEELGNDVVQNICFCDDKWDEKGDTAIFQCEVCNIWIHFECANMNEDIERDHVCPGCRQTKKAEFISTSTYFEKQHGEQCLLQASRMATQNPDLLNEKQMDAGVIAHTTFLKATYPEEEWDDWCEAWTGGKRGDWRASDALRALKATLGDGNFTWRRVKSVTKSGILFSDNMKHWRKEKQLVLVGYATESDVKTHLRKQVDPKTLRYKPLKNVKGLG
jgi:hypothetical protein